MPDSQDSPNSYDARGGPPPTSLWRVLTETVVGDVDGLAWMGWVIGAVALCVGLVYVFAYVLG